MQTTLRRKMRWGAACVAVALAGCGSGPVPTSPSTPAPPRLAAIFGDPSTNALVTVDIDPDNGALKPKASSPIRDALTATSAYGTFPVGFHLAADPRGRFVYMAIGHELVSYALDGTTGALSERSRVLIDPQILYTSSLVASERQVHGIFEVGQAYNSHVKWVAFQLDPATGALGGRTCFEGCELSLPDRGRYGPHVVVADATGRWVYTDDGYALVTSAVQPNGSVADASRLPLGVFAEAGASAPTFVALSDGLGVEAVAIDTSGGLSPGPPAYPMSDDADVRALAIASNGALALSGVRNFHTRTSSINEPWNVQTFRVSASGAIESRGSVTLPPTSIGRSLTWDPSGRFLYVITLDSPGIEAYADVDGVLRPIGSYAWGNRSLITLTR